MNDKLLLDCVDFQGKKDIITASSSQPDVYDIVRGSGTPSPKSCDSQFSVEDKVYSIIATSLDKQSYKLQKEGSLLFH